jgi:hypothetical protein
MSTLKASMMALVLTAAAAADVFDFVDQFIGTASGANGGSGGNAFPGAAIPHGMAKVRPSPPAHISHLCLLSYQVGIDVDTTPRQAGYISDNSSVTGEYPSKIIPER